MGELTSRDHVAVLLLTCIINFCNQATLCYYFLSKEYSRCYGACSGFIYFKALLIRAFLMVSSGNLLIVSCLQKAFMSSWVGLVDLSSTDHVAVLF